MIRTIPFLAHPPTTDNAPQREVAHRRHYCLKVLHNRRQLRVVGKCRHAWSG